MSDYKYEHFNDDKDKTDRVSNLFCYLFIGIIAVFFIGGFVSQFI